MLEMTFDKIIPLGAHCNITYLLQKLKIKKETSLFEWFESSSLNAINAAINAIDFDNVDTNLIGGEDKRIELCNPDIVSMHYTIDDFKPIFVRRAKRFIETIQNNNLLFVRINLSYYATTLCEIEQFLAFVRRVNPGASSNMKFLLISTIESMGDFVPIVHEHVVHKYFLKSDINDYIMADDIKIHIILKRYLEEIGYNTEGVLDATCDEHS